MASAGASSISAFFIPRTQETDSLQIKITKAEAVLCHFVAESNLPLSSMDKLTVAVKAIFPDSKIATGKLSLILCRLNERVNEGGGGNSISLSRIFQFSPHFHVRFV